MQKAAYLMVFLAMITGALWLAGCGSSDILDELETQQTVSLSVFDGPNDGTDLDIASDDCDFNASTGDDDSLVYAWGISAIVDATDLATPLQVNSYEITFAGVSGIVADPGSGSYTFTPIVLPAPLNPIRHTYTTPLVLTGSNLTFTVPQVWTPDHKYHFLDLLAAALGSYADAYDSTSTYNVQVTLYCTDASGDSVTLIGTTAIALWDYFNCSS